MPSVDARRLFTIRPSCRIVMPQTGSSIELDPIQLIDYADNFNFNGDNVDASVNNSYVRTGMTLLHNKHFQQTSIITLHLIKLCVTNARHYIASRFFLSSLCSLMFVYSHNVKADMAIRFWKSPNKIIAKWFSYNKFRIHCYQKLSRLSPAQR